jgi:hypothetical protein
MQHALIMVTIHMPDGTVRETKSNRTRPLIECPSRSSEACSRLKEVLDRLDDGEAVRKRRRMRRDKRDALAAEKAARLMIRKVFVWLFLIVVSCIM